MTSTPPPPAEPSGATAVRPSRAERRAKWWAETKMDLKWASVLLFVLILAISGWLSASWDRVPATEEDLGQVTTTIFSLEGLVVPFELLSVLLLAALVAGIVIAFRDPEEEP